MNGGVLRIGDLYARSERRPWSACWWWTGAKCGASPRIWTYDHDRHDKRVMSGPRAVWNIAKGQGLGGRLAYMTCINSQCVNPRHVASAASKLELGAAISKSGKRKGTQLAQRRAAAEKGHVSAGIVPTPAAVVLAIRAAGPGPTNLQLAARFGMKHNTVSRIRRGDSHKHLLVAA